MAYISSKADEVVAERLGMDSAEFEEQLRTAVFELEQAFPDRFRSLVSQSDEHTFLIRQFDFLVLDTTVREWVRNMISGDESWVSVNE